MATRTLLFVAFAAVAVQCAVGWSFSTPSLLGGSVTLGSSASSKSLGGKVGLDEAGAIAANVELGPLDGIQAKIVTPTLPNLGDLLKNIHETVGKLTGRLLGGIGRIGGWARGIVGNGLGLLGIKLPSFNLFEKIVTNFRFAFGNITNLVSIVGGILEKAVKAGALSLKEAGNVISAILKSALEKTVNNVAKLIDALTWAIKKKILLDKTAVELLVKAVRGGLHKTDSASKWALDAFLDKAAKAETITQDAADKLKSFINAGGKADEAEDKADEAEDKADEAEKKADEAKDKADEAEKKADEAEKKADEAKDKADEAEKKADDAEKTADDAEKKADDAEKKADDAEKTADDAEKKADDAEKKADDAEKTADDAEKKADDAEKTADDAEKKADDAEKTADDAEKKADDAEKTADDAEKKADDAEKTADDAEKKADDAEKTADDAEKKADDAEKTADDAEKKADDAEKTADDAEKTADDAKDTADEAEKKADDAKDTADEAKDAAEEAKAEA